MTFQKFSWRNLAILAGIVICLIANRSSVLAQGDAPLAEPGVHPLDKPLQWARDGLQRIDQSTKDYSCTLIKRERIKGELSGHEFIFTKVRHKPFSVYMYFLKPTAKKGNECIYVEGENGDKLWAIAGSGFKRRLGVVSLGVDSASAMEGNRYPVTMTGFRVLVERLIEMGETDKKYGECEPPAVGTGIGMGVTFLVGCTLGALGAATYGFKSLILPGVVMTVATWRCEES